MLAIFSCFIWAVYKLAKVQINLRVSTASADSTVLLFAVFRIIMLVYVTGLVNFPAKIKIEQGFPCLYKLKSFCLNI